MSHPEALVVGAGPAGSLAALVLARAGVRVRLIDRDRFPRHKLCGDTLNPGALSILDSLDAAARGERRALGAAVRSASRSIRGMTVTGPGQSSVTAEYPDGLRGVSIARRDLDLLLLQAAVDAGAAFDDGVIARAPIVDEGRVTGVRVAGRGGDGVLPAAVVIAADGRASRLASAAGLSAFARHPRRWAFGAYFCDVRDVAADLGEMHIRPDLYMGIAPLAGDAVNVCVVRSLSSGQANPNPRQVIADAVAGDSGLRDRFRAARQVSPLVTLGPLAVQARASGMPGLLLAGDAAGFVDPMTGDGLRFALRGGVLAAHAALEELSSGRSASRSLQAARVREFGGKWRINRALRLLSGSPRAVAGAAWLAKRWPAPVQVLIGVAGDVGIARRQFSGPVLP